jgi:hypothetical protein
VVEIVVVFNSERLGAEFAGLGDEGRRFVGLPKLSGCNFVRERVSLVLLRLDQILLTLIGWWV